jgi:hypothetical protein
MYGQTTKPALGFYMKKLLKLVTALHENNHQ